MRHTQHTMTVTNIVAETSRGGIHIGKFQHTHTDATMIDGDFAGMLTPLLSVYNQMYTVMNMASLTHFSIFGPGVAELLDKGSDNVAARVAPAPTSTAKSSISRMATFAINGLDSALNLLADQLDHEALADVDSQKYNLVRSMSFCRQWLSHMRAFLHGAQRELSRLVSRHLQVLATELENSVPRWSALFPLGPIDWDLAAGRLLAHPRRSSVAPLIKVTKNIMNEFNNMRASFTSDAMIDSSISAFVADCLSNAEDYLLVTAAVNTLVNHHRLSNAAAQAQEIIDIGSRKASFAFPDCLKLALQSATMGKPPTQAGHKRLAPDDVAADSAQASASTASKFQKLDKFSRLSTIKSEAGESSHTQPEGATTRPVAMATASSASSAGTSAAAPSSSTKAPMASGLSRPARSARKRVT